MEYPGNLFVVAAPSGAGKSSLVKSLLELDSHLVVSISHTTRPPRGQEQDGREYHFIDGTKFQAMIAAGAFFEWAEVHGNLYGTSRSGVESLVAGGSDVVLEIDWQGALQIKTLFPNAVLIFILPPSFEELAQRLANARHEVAQAPKFDFVIINGSLENALAELRAVVREQPEALRFAAQRANHPDRFAALGLA
jgi:guanylate kinase